MKNKSKNLLRDETINVRRYYHFHAHFYDLTRWSFLFGKNSLRQNLPSLPTNPRILEIGCGTGQNIPLLRQQFPEAHLIGIDYSEAMLRKAAPKVKGDPRIRLINANYGSTELNLPPINLVLLSYSLSIAANKPEYLLDCIQNDLNSGGYIAVVDFHATPSALFRRWMRFNNVSLNGLILPQLNYYFQSVRVDVKQAYFGLWSYFTFVGRSLNSRYYKMSYPQVD